MNRVFPSPDPCISLQSYNKRQNGRVTWKDEAISAQVIHKSPISQGPTGTKVLGTIQSYLISWATKFNVTAKRDHVLRVVFRDARLAPRIPTLSLSLATTSRERHPWLGWTHSVLVLGLAH